MDLRAGQHRQQPRKIQGRVVHPAINTRTGPQKKGDALLNRLLLGRIKRHKHRLRRMQGSDLFPQAEGLGFALEIINADTGTALRRFKRNSAS
jgi:hypothetical protein